MAKNKLKRLADVVAEANKRLSIQLEYRALYDIFAKRCAEDAKRRYWRGKHRDAGNYKPCPKTRDRNERVIEQILKDHNMTWDDIPTTDFTRSECAKKLRGRRRPSRVAVTTDDRIAELERRVKKLEDCVKSQSLQ